MSDRELCIEFVREQAQGEWGEDIIHKDAAKLEALLDRVRKEERDRCLDWVAAHARICGCSDRIAAAIRGEG